MEKHNVSGTNNMSIEILETVEMYYENVLMQDVCMIVMSHLDQ